MGSDAKQFHNDEFCVVRIRDAAIIIDRMFLSDEGISSSPIVPAFATRTANRDLALSIHGRLAAEDAGQVSFGKFLRKV